MSNRFNNLDVSLYPPGTPFRRAKATCDAIQTANTFISPTRRSIALAAIPAYQSRGKGKGKGFTRTSGVPSGNKCNQSYDEPGHNGEREMARRVRQTRNGTHGYATI